MAVFKRVELWLLLVITGVGTWFILREPAIDPDKAPDLVEGDAPEAKESPHRLNGIVLSWDESGFVIEIAAVFDNTGTQALEVSNRTAHLALPDGSQVKPFFTPFDPGPTIVDPGEQSPVVLRYWADESALRGTLDLQLGDDSLSVKDGEFFDTARLPETGSLRIGSATWESRSLPAS